MFGSGGREFQPESGAASQVAVHFNNSVVLLDNAVAHRQPQAGTFARCFCREERVVNAGQMIGRDAVPGVGHFNVDEARLRPCAHRQLAAFLHGIASVNEQIEKHLLELMFDAEHRHRRRDHL